MLLKEILAWRNNEFKMGHEMNFWKLDEIVRNVGVVPFQSEEGYMYDPEKHEEEEWECRNFENLKIAPPNRN